MRSYSELVTAISDLYSAISDLYSNDAALSEDLGLSVTA
jgi:hypothetical protein